MRYATALLAALLFCTAPAWGQLAPPPAEIEDVDVEPDGATKDARLNARYTYEEGMQYGRRYGQEKSTAAWTVGSFVGGFLAGPIGAGIGYGLAKQKVPETTKYRSGLVDTYSRDFYGGWAAGYEDVYDRRRESAALTGGLIGTAVGVTAAILLAR
jgi:hypothetical protein